MSEVRKELRKFREDAVAELKSFGASAKREFGFMKAYMQMFGRNLRDAKKFDEHFNATCDFYEVPKKDRKYLYEVCDTRIGNLSLRERNDGITVGRILEETIRQHSGVLMY